DHLQVELSHEVDSAGLFAFFIKTWQENHLTCLVDESQVIA
ncbi:MAG: hypothetical protein HW420_1546, partial [Candidatus Nitrosotenuis sp.]|nr:hypothetical protein [Candidatus Nitrosotenuis sp.]